MDLPSLPSTKGLYLCPMSNLLQMAGPSWAKTITVGQWVRREGMYKALGKWFVCAKCRDGGDIRGYVNKHGRVLKDDVHFETF